MGKILIAVLVLLAACSAPATTSVRPTPTPAPSGLGSRADFVAAFEGEGFSGHESPLQDGTPRWLGQRASDQALAEAIGPENGLTQVSLLIAANSENGTLAGTFLNTYAPGSRPFFQDVLAATGAEGADESKVIAGRTVRVQIIALGADALVTLTVT